MIDRKVVRYLVYLFVSIVLIYFLWFLSNEESKSPVKKVENSDIKYEIDPNTGDTIGKKINDVLFIQLPTDSAITNQFNTVDVSIDSANNLSLNQESITLNELEKELDVQLKKKPKLMLKIFVHSKSDSGVLLKIVKMSHERNIKIGIKTLK